MCGEEFPEESLEFADCCTLASTTGSGHYFLCGSSSSTAPSPSPASSRPTSRLTARPREAKDRLFQKVESEDRKEGWNRLASVMPAEGSHSFNGVVRRERHKQESWLDYFEADCPKKIISEFEEWQRVLHSPRPPVKKESVDGAAGANAKAGHYDPDEYDPEDDTSSEEEVEDTSDPMAPFRNAPQGFTQFTAYEVRESAYAKRCRETYSMPLGPRGGKYKSSASKSTAASLASQELPGVPQLPAPDTLQFGGWSLGSERLDMLCETKGVGFSGCRTCNLAGNRIQDESVELLCGQILPTVEILNLAGNELTKVGVKQMSMGLYSLGRESPLLELNLEGNNLGAEPNRCKLDAPGRLVAADVLEADLCKFVESLEVRCPLLRALSLAQNNLGKVGNKLGEALGSLIKNLRRLQTVDLHWNSFHGHGAYGLLEGVYDNGHSGVLSRFDISYNNLGTVTEARSGAIPARVLAGILEDNKILFHLDISYNQFTPEDCTKIAESLRKNQTLYGLHIEGSPAAVDDDGYLIALQSGGPERGRDPPKGKARGKVELKAGQKETSGRKKPVRHTMETSDKVQEFISFSVAEKTVAWDPLVAKQFTKRKTQEFNKDLKRQNTAGKSVKVNEKANCILVDDDNDDEDDWRAQHAVPLAGSLEAHHNLSGHIGIRAQQCWICDRWRIVVLKWIPGVSSVMHADEVDKVEAFVSSDGFRKPTMLKRFMKNGHVWWEAHRMVPPETARNPLLGIFRVNESVEVANNLPLRQLLMPTSVGAEEDGGSWRFANQISQSQRGNFVITEDEAKSGNLTVKPRTGAAEDKGPAELEKWEPSKSILHSWRKYNEPLLEKMLAFDMKFIKLDKFMGKGKFTPNGAEILPYYGAIVSTYRKHAIWAGETRPFGVSLSVFEDILSKCDGLFDKTFSREHIASICISAQVMDKAVADQVRVHNEHTMVRFQFCEAVIRIANSKYIQQGSANNLAEALEALFKDIGEVFTADEADTKEFLDWLMCEEVDLVLRAHLNMLHSGFDIYAGSQSVMSSGSRGKKNMSVLDWHAFLNDCQSYDESFTRKKGIVAFEMGTMWHVDEVTNDRHMQMNFTEFLVGIGAAVYMREYFFPEEFADLLEEFISDTVKPQIDEAMKQNMNSSGASTSKRGGEQVAGSKFRKVIQEAFEQSDEDGNHVLTLREFRLLLRDPQVVTLLAGKEYTAETFLQLFEQMDTDGDGHLSFEEVVTGMGKVRHLELSETRARAFLNKLFIDADADCDGKLHTFEVIGCLCKLTTQRKLTRAGVAPEGIHDMLKSTVKVKDDKSNQRLTRIFKAAFEDSSGKDACGEEELKNLCKTDCSFWSVKELVSMILRMRHVKEVPRWKVMLMQIFEDADEDCSGTLTKAEFNRMLNQTQTRNKFLKIGIPQSALTKMFELLDEDGSASLDLHEMLVGFERLVASAVHQEPQASPSSRGRPLSSRPSTMKRD